MNQDVLKKIQQKVKLQSVNSLGNLYPDDIIEWLDISEEETKELIDFLHSQRILSYKYEIKCRCSEICTVYENKLARNGEFYCDICGQKFTIEDIKERGEIIYEIDKKELLNIEKQEVDFKVLPIRSKVASIKQRQGERKVMEIFMGSSSEAKDFMDEITVKLEELQVSPLLWNATGKGIFVAGENTIDALIKITKRVQAAIFIFNADDITWNDKSALEAFDSVRDNVLFEYGLFVGALGKEKVCFVCKGKPDLASDLKGIIYIDGDSGIATVKSELKDWINAIK